MPHARLCKVTCRRSLLLCFVFVEEGSKSSSSSVTTTSSSSMHRPLRYNGQARKKKFEKDPITNKIVVEQYDFLIARTKSPKGLSANDHSRDRRMTAWCRMRACGKNGRSTSTVGDEAREQKIIAKTTERNTAVGSRNKGTFHFPTLATLPVWSSPLPLVTHLADLHLLDPDVFPLLLDLHPAPMPPCLFWWQEDLLLLGLPSTMKLPSVSEDPTRPMKQLRLLRINLLLTGPVILWWVGW